MSDGFAKIREALHLARPGAFTEEQVRDLGAVKDEASFIALVGSDPDLAGALDNARRDPAFGEALSVALADRYDKFLTLVGGPEGDFDRVQRQARPPRRARIPERRPSAIDGRPWPEVWFHWLTLQKNPLLRQRGGPTHTIDLSTPLESLSDTLNRTLDGLPSGKSAIYAACPPGVTFDAIKALGLRTRIRLKEGQIVFVRLGDGAMVKVSRPGASNVSVFKKADVAHEIDPYLNGTSAAEAIHAIRLVSPWGPAPNPKRVTALISEWVGRPGATYAQLSEAIQGEVGFSISGATLSKYVNQGRRISFACLEALARFLKVDTRDLIHQENLALQDDGLSPDDWVVDDYPIYIEREDDLNRLKWFKDNDPERKTLGWLLYAERKNPEHYFNLDRFKRETGIGIERTSSHEKNEVRPAVITLAKWVEHLKIAEGRIIEAFNKTYNRDHLDLLERLFPHQHTFIDPATSDLEKILSYADRPGTIGQFLFAWRKSLPGFKRASEMQYSKNRPTDPDWDGLERNKRKITTQSAGDWMSVFSELGIPLSVLTAFFEKEGVDQKSVPFLIAAAMGKRTQREVTEEAGVNENTIRDLLDEERRKKTGLETLVKLKRTLPNLDAARIFLAMQPDIMGIGEFFPEALEEDPALSLSQFQIDWAFGHFHLHDLLYEYRMSFKADHESFAKALGDPERFRIYEKNAQNVEDPYNLRNIAIVLARKMYADRLKGKGLLRPDDPRQFVDLGEEITGLSKAEATKVFNEAYADAKKIVYLHFRPGILRLFTIKDSKGGHEITISDEGYAQQLLNRHTVRCHADLPARLAYAIARRAEREGIVPPPQTLDQKGAYLARILGERLRRKIPEGRIRRLLNTNDNFSLSIDEMIAMAQEFPGVTAYELYEYPRHAELAYFLGTHEDGNINYDLPEGISWEMLTANMIRGMIDRQVAEKFGGDRREAAKVTIPSLAERGNFSSLLARQNVHDHSIERLAIGLGLDRRLLYLYFRRDELKAVTQAAKPAPKPPKLSPLVHIVVPVYRELENGNFFRLIESFTAQTASFDTFELTLVINHSPEIAADVENPVRLENIKTVVLARFIAGTGERPAFFDSLSPWEKEVLLRARERGLRIKVIDKTVEGFPKNIGAIRSLGFQEILRAYPDHADVGVMAMMDADTVVPSDYVEKISLAFRDPTLEALFLNMSHVPTGSETDENVFRTAALADLTHIWDDHFFNVIISPRGVKVGVGAPQIVARLSAVRDAGGIPELVSGEDDALSKLLSQRGYFRWAHDIEVVTADRVRDDGFNAGIRDFDQDPVPGASDTLRPLEVRNPLFYLFVQVLKNIHKASTEILDRESAARLFRFFGIPFDDERWEVFLAEARDQWNADLNWLVPAFSSTYFPSGESHLLTREPDRVFLEFLMRHLPQAEYSHLEKMINQGAKRHDRLRDDLTRILRVVVANLAAGRQALEGIEDKRVLRFVQTNPRIGPFIEENRDRFRSEEDGWSFLVDYFPDWLKPFDETPVKQTAVRLGVLTKFLQEVRNQPERFPTMQRILSLVDGSISMADFLGSWLAPALDSQMTEEGRRKLLEEFLKKNQGVIQALAQRSLGATAPHFTLQSVNRRAVSPHESRYNVTLASDAQPVSLILEVVIRGDQITMGPASNADKPPQIHRFSEAGTILDEGENLWLHVMAKLPAQVTFYACVPEAIFESYWNQPSYRYALRPRKTRLWLNPDHLLSDPWAIDVGSVILRFEMSRKEVIAAVRAVHVRLEGITMPLRPGGSINFSLVSTKPEVDRLIAQSYTGQPLNEVQLIDAARRIKKMTVRRLWSEATREKVSPFGYPAFEVAFLNLPEGIDAPLIHGSSHRGRIFRQRRGDAQDHNPRIENALLLHEAVEHTFRRVLEDLGLFLAHRIATWAEFLCIYKAGFNEEYLSFILDRARERDLVEELDFVSENSTALFDLLIPKAIGMAQTSEPAVATWFRELLDSYDREAHNEVWRTLANRARVLKADDGKFISRHRYAPRILKEGLEQQGTRIEMGYEETCHFLRGLTSFQTGFQTTLLHDEHASTLSLLVSRLDADDFPDWRELPFEFSDPKFHLIFQSKVLKRAITLEFKMTRVRDKVFCEVHLIPLPPDPFIRDEDTGFHPLADLDLETLRAVEAEVRQYLSLVWSFARNMDIRRDEEQLPRIPAFAAAFTLASEPLHAAAIAPTDASVEPRRSSMVLSRAIHAAPATTIMRILGDHPGVTLKIRRKGEEEWTEVKNMMFLMMLTLEASEEIEWEARGRGAGTVLEKLSLANDTKWPLSRSSKHAVLIHRVEGASGLNPEDLAGAVYRFMKLCGKTQILALYNPTTGVLILSNADAHLFIAEAARLEDDLKGARLLKVSFFMMYNEFKQVVRTVENRPAEATNLPDITGIPLSRFARVSLGHMTPRPLPAHRRRENGITREQLLHSYPAFRFRDTQAVRLPNLAPEDGGGAVNYVGSRDSRLLVIRTAQGAVVPLERAFFTYGARGYITVMIKGPRGWGLVHMPPSGYLGYATDDLTNSVSIIKRGIGAIADSPDQCEVLVVGSEFRGDWRTTWESQDRIEGLDRVRKQLNEEGVTRVRMIQVPLDSFSLLAQPDRPGSVFVFGRPKIYEDQYNARVLINRVHGFHIDITGIPGDPAVITIPHDTRPDLATGHGEEESRPFSEILLATAAERALIGYQDEMTIEEEPLIEMEGRLLPEIERLEGEGNYFEAAHLATRLAWRYLKFDDQTDVQNALDSNPDDYLPPPIVYVLGSNSERIHQKRWELILRIEEGAPAVPEPLDFTLSRERLAKALKAWSAGDGGWAQGLIEEIIEQNLLIDQAAYSFARWFVKVIELEKYLRELGREPREAAVVETFIVSSLSQIVTVLMSGSEDHTGVLGPQDWAGVQKAILEQLSKLVSSVVAYTLQNRRYPMARDWNNFFNDYHAWITKFSDDEGVGALASYWLLRFGRTYYEIYGKDRSRISHESLAKLDALLPRLTALCDEGRLSKEALDDARNFRARVEAYLKHGAELTLFPPLPVTVGLASLRPVRNEEMQISGWEPVWDAQFPPMAVRLQQRDGKEVIVILEKMTGHDAQELFHDQKYPDAGGYLTIKDSMIFVARSLTGEVLGYQVLRQTGASKTLDAVRYHKKIDDKSPQEILGLNMALIAYTLTTLKSCWEGKEPGQAVIADIDEDVLQGIRGKPIGGVKSPIPSPREIAGIAAPLQTGFIQRREVPFILSRFALSPVPRPHAIADRTTPPRGNEPLKFMPGPDENYHELETSRPFGVRRGIESPDHVRTRPDGMLIAGAGEFAVGLAPSHTGLQKLNLDSTGFKITRSHALRGNELLQPTERAGSSDRARALRRRRSHLRFASLRARQVARTRNLMRRM